MEDITLKESFYLAQNRPLKHFFLISLGLFLITISCFHSNLCAQCTINAGEHLDQANSAFLMGSSFTACCDGVLKTLKVWCAEPGGKTGRTLKFYKGESLAYSDWFATINDISLQNGISSIDLTSANISVTNGQQYTFYFANPTNIYYQSENYYPSGNLAYNGSFCDYVDLAFILEIGAPASTAPATQALNVSFSNTSPSGTTVSWTRGNGDYCAVFMTAASSGNAAPVDETTYAAGTIFGTGTQIGASGWYCIYNGSSINVTVSGLNPGTAYRVHVCEYNEGAGSELYLTDAGMDNPDNVTTEDATITFTDGSGFTPSIAYGSSNQAIGRFQLTGDVHGAALTAASIQLSGTRTGLSNLKLWSSTDAVFESASDTQVDGPESDGSSVSFSGFSSDISSSGVYYFITADVAADATGSVQGVIAGNASLTLNKGQIFPNLSNEVLSDSDVSLPVTLSSFSARCQGQSVILEWKTESELDNLGFMLERSLDNQTWTTIASYQTDDALKAQGNTSSATEYSFIDKNVQPEETCTYRLSHVSTNGNVHVYASLDITTDALPKTTEMEKAFPNPFNPETYIAYHLANNADVNITVFDMLGRQLKTLYSGNQLAGNYHIYWDATTSAGSKVPTGTYVIRMQAGDVQKIQKVMLIK